MTPDTQAVIENAIHTLVTEFREDPYRFFTEADAVARFHQILETDLTVDQNLVTLDGYKTSTLHQKYPTFFRFDDKNPIARLDPDSRASRGHYDIVILNERFVRTHDVETVKNRDFRSIRDTSVPPL